MRPRDRRGLGGPGEGVGSGAGRERARWSEVTFLLATIMERWRPVMSARVSMSVVDQSGGKGYVFRIVVNSAPRT